MSNKRRGLSDDNPSRIITPPISNEEIDALYSGKVILTDSTEEKEFMQSHDGICGCKFPITKDLTKIKHFSSDECKCAIEKYLSNINKLSR